jgi:hypothetical protein
MIIRLNKKVFLFLYEKLNKDIDSVYEILDMAIYHADQNVSSQEKVVLASKKVAEIIEANWGPVDFGGLPETQYCELVQK